MEHTRSILGSPPDNQMSIAVSEGEPELLEQKFGCAAAPAVAMPEPDLEMTAMLSRGR